ncbi:retrograde transport, endosome to Golgi [Branchiostoma belcheri]|nr:retrograde transport, endosome to Golgi [Branchiostoma belcheri]
MPEEAWDPRRSYEPEIPGPVGSAFGSHPRGCGFEPCPCHRSCALGKGTLHDFPHFTQTNGPTATAPGQSNGPVTAEASMNGSDPTPTGPSWERPWTLDELRTGSTNWSLASDAGLLLHLREFSQRMISRTHEMGKQVDGLMHEMKATDTRVHNVFNSFLMLANTQFVENRVYDEDVSEDKNKSENEEKKTDQEKTREQREAELIPKVAEALGYGLSVIDNAFETLDIKAGQSDSEDEETGYKAEPILEAKDPYVHRPLPCIIGSQAFIEDDEVGLGDVASEDEELASDHGSVSESESEKDMSGSDSESSGSEEEESGSEEGVKHGKSRAKKAGGFAAELASRIGGAPIPQPESDEDNWEEEKKTKKEEKRERTESTSKDDLFGPPPMEEEEDSPFGGKGLFSGGGGLFDDEPSRPPEPEVGESCLQAQCRGDDDLFASSPPKETKQPSVPKAASSGGLFEAEDDDEDLFSMGGATKPPPLKKEESKPKPKAGFDLFGEDDEEEEGEGGGLFGGAPAAKPAAPEQKKQEEAPQKKLPPGAVSMFGKRRNQRRVCFSHLPLKISVPAKKASVKSPAVTQTKSQPKKPAAGLSLFSDEEESGDLFGGSAPAVKEPEKRPDSKETADTKTGKSSLFEDEGDDLFSAGVKANNRKKPPGGVDLFGGADVFGRDKVGKTEVDESKTALPKPKQISMFDEDEKDDDSASTKSQESFGKASLASSDSGGRSSTTPAEKPAGPLGLFGDDVEADGGLFSSPAANKDTKTKKQDKPAKQAKSLFADEDVLFGGQEETPDVDLFSSSSSSKPAPKHDPEEKPAAQPAKPAGGGMFGEEDEEEDFFSSKPSAEKQATTPSPEEKKPKKLAGAVSMFGGIDPAALLKKKVPAEKKEAASDPLLGEQPSPSPTSEESSPVVQEEKPVKPEGFKSVKPPKGRQASSAIGKLQASLAINPSAMLPGAAPPVKEPESVPVSFDQPMQTKTLESLSKDRAKIQTKRRLPSRRGRRAGAGQQRDSTTSPDSPSDLSSALPQPTGPPSLFGNEGESTTAKDTPVSVGGSKDETDNMDDIFGSSKKVAKPASSKASLDEDLFGSAPAASITKGSLEGDDLFSSASTRTPPPLSANNTSAEADLFSAAKTKPVQEKKSSDLSTGNDDDLFSSQSSKSTVTAPKKTGKLGEMPEDDIFATEAASTSTKPKKYKAVTPESSLFSDDTNIFADIPATKPKEKKKKTTKATTKTKGLFKDELVDDIFAEAGSNVSKKAKPKKKPAKKSEPQGDIFDDDTTDILQIPSM